MAETRWMVLDSGADLVTVVDMVFQEKYTCRRIVAQRVLPAETVWTMVEAVA